MQGRDSYRGPLLPYEKSILSRVPRNCQRSIGSDHNTAHNRREACGASAFMVRLGLPVRSCPLAVFASRKVAVSDARKLRFEFDLDKRSRPDCREIATRTSAALSFRFVGKPRDPSKSGRVLVSPLRASPNQGLAYTPRSTVSPQRPPRQHRDGIRSASRNRSPRSAKYFFSRYLTHQPLL